MYRKGQEVSISASSIENPFKFDGIMNAEKGMSDFLMKFHLETFWLSVASFFNKQKHVASAVNVYLDWKNTNLNTISHGLASLEPRVCVFKMLSYAYYNSYLNNFSGLKVTVENLKKK